MFRLKIQLLLLLWDYLHHQCYCRDCISNYCQSINGCHISDTNAKTIRCPSEASCFLRVRIQVDDNIPVITEVLQGCASTWDYMKSDNGSRTCFNGPDDGYRTCLCADGNLCNKQLHDVNEYRRLPLEIFPPLSTRWIDCVESGVIYSGQSYCTYRRSIGRDHQWLRRAHGAGHVSELENSQRDHLCFQDDKEIDCYCKTDRCNDIVPPAGIMSPFFFIGAYDDKVECCRGEIDRELTRRPQDLLSDPSPQANIFRQCLSNAVCTGDYCFIKFKYNAVKRTVIGRQTCYNTSSELTASHRFEGMEYGPYRERVLYCRQNFCNRLDIVHERISAATPYSGSILLVTVGHLICASARIK